MCRRIRLDTEAWRTACRPRCVPGRLSRTAESDRPADVAVSERMKVSVAKNKLPELIKTVEYGETVIICRQGVPAVDIIQTKKPNRKRRGLGTLKAKFRFSTSTAGNLCWTTKPRPFEKGEIRCGCSQWTRPRFESAVAGQ